MSFTPSLSLFIGLGVAVAVLSTVLAIVVDRIDTRLAQRSCEKAIAARRARKAREALQLEREVRRESLSNIAMGVVMAKTRS